VETNLHSSICLCGVYKASLPLLFTSNACLNSVFKSASTTFQIVAGFLLFSYTGYTQKILQFQKLTRNLFLTLHGHNLRRQQRQLSKFFMRYQQFAFGAYCGAAGPVFKMASQQEKVFCVIRFEVSRSVITVQREFRARFRKDAPCVFSKPYATPSWKLAPLHRSKHEKRTAGSAWETWTVAAADGVGCARVRWEINFLLTFETAPFFCVYPVLWDAGNR